MQTQKAMQTGTEAAPIRALVIEDEEADRFRLITMCRRAGLDLDFAEAADAGAVRDCIAESSFDIIFIDYHLGFSTGLEALAEIVACERQANAVLIMVTSVNQHDVIIEAMKNGCSDYLIKEELSIEGIRKSVATAFEKRLLHTALHEERAKFDAARDAVIRFDQVIAPAMRRVMSAMLWRVRAMAANKPGSNLEKNDLEALCFEALDLVNKGHGLADIPNQSAIASSTRP